MPEGPALHRLARDHRRWFAGRPVAVTSPQGRFPAATALDGQVLVTTEAYGKHLFHHYDGGRIVQIHLGLIGRFFHHPVPPPLPRATARLRLIGEADAVDLVGATVCRQITPGERDDILARLGPDPLRRGADPDRAFAALQRRSVGIGRALMDQGVLAGVGNVYRAELLHAFRLHPDQPARDVPKDTWDAMWATLVGWMRDAVRQGRIVTTTRAELGLGPRQRLGPDERFHVYRREHCRRCGSPIRRWDLAGRWAYACESCQPPPT